MPRCRNWRTSDSSATVRTARRLKRCNASSTPCNPSRPDGVTAVNDATTLRSAEKFASPPLIALRTRARRGTSGSIENGPSSSLPSPSAISSVTASSLVAVNNRWSTFHHDA